MKTERLRPLTFWVLTFGRGCCAGHLNRPSLLLPTLCRARQHGRPPFRRPDMASDPAPLATTACPPGPETMEMAFAVAGSRPGSKTTVQLLVKTRHAPLEKPKDLPWCARLDRGNGAGGSGQNPNPTTPSTPQKPCHNLFISMDMV